jgi:hypothetical protein
MAEITELQKETFLERLGECGNVAEAARSAGLSTMTVYALRKQDAAFAEAIAEALESGIDLLEHELLRRALHGWSETVFYEGKPCGEVTKHSDRLGMFLLKAHRPQTYGNRRTAEKARSPWFGEILAAIDGKTRGLEGFK